MRLRAERVRDGADLSSCSYSHGETTLVLGLVYAANIDGTQRLSLRALNALASQPIVGTEYAHAPFFSPDGEQIGFFNSSFGSSGYMHVSVRGGAPVRLCECDPSPQMTESGREFAGATWLPDGTILVVAATGPGASGNGIHRVRDAGAVPERLTTPDAERGKVAHVWPQALPGGTAVLYTILTDFRNMETSSVAVLALDTGEQHIVLEDAYNARYLTTGHLVFGRQGSLWGVPFDLDRLVATEPERELVDGIDQSGLGGGMAFAVSTDGSLAYVAGDANRSDEAHVLVWVDRDGREEPIPMPARPYYAARLSPDGTRIAVEVQDPNTDIWVHDLARGKQTRLTFDPGLDRFPVWTPDGERIAFASDRGGGPYDVFWKLAVGTREPGLVVSDPDRRLDPWSWTPDGQSLLINEGGMNVGMVTLGGDQSRRPVLDVAATEGVPEISPDGRWMAYRSAESGRMEVYVRPFPDVQSSKWQVSTNGGTYPAWSPDGQELFYRTLDGSSLMGVMVEAEPSFNVGVPEVRVTGAYVYAAGQGRNWDMSPDGTRFLVLKSVGHRSTEDSASLQITVVLNWTQELLERVPID